MIINHKCSHLRNFVLHFTMIGGFKLLKSGNPRSQQKMLREKKKWIKTHWVNIADDYAKLIEKSRNYD